MEKYNLLVIDNFYNNPDEIRKLALSLPFQRRHDARYPGKEAISSNTEWKPIIERIQTLISEACKYENIKDFYYPQGKFHLAIKSDQNTRNISVHTDLPKWSAVVYLSKIYDPRGGTQWYKHRPTGEVQDSDTFLKYCFKGVQSNSKDEMRKIITDNSKDMTQWEEIQSVAMCYNRLVLFRADFL